MNNEILHDESYTIGQVVMMTGLTDRTIRNYLSLGFLEGEKQDGQWRFTAEQLEEFMRHPSVKPSISAKKNALIFDFLADTVNYTKWYFGCLHMDKYISPKVQAVYTDVLPLGEEKKKATPVEWLLFW